MSYWTKRRKISKKVNQYENAGLSSGATPISDLTEEPDEINDIRYDDSSSETNVDHADSDVSENGDVDSDSTQSSDG